MNSLRFYCFLILMLGSFSAVCQQTKTSENKKFNVLLLYMDDLRPELGCYGQNDIKSPHIDRLSSEGIQFNNAFCNVPVCGASRASMLTGMLPTTQRFLNYNTFVEKEVPKAITLPQLFKQNGYTTISNGKVYHHLDDREDDWNEIWRPYAFEPNDSGLSPTDYWQSVWKDYQKDENIAEYKETNTGPAYEKASVPDSAYIDGIVTQKTIRDLKKLKQTEQPFFLAAGFISPHLPFNAPSRHWEKYQRQAIKLPENNRIPENAPKISISNWGEMRAYSNIPKEGDVTDSLAVDLIHGYRATVSYVDHLIGEIMATLKETGLDKNTIVLLVSDHGYHLQENAQWAKFTNYRIATRVPMIFKIPGIEGGKSTQALADLTDVYPTLAELCKLKIPKDQLDGRSLLSNIRDASLPGKTSVFIKRNNGFTLQTTNFSYTQYLDLKTFKRNAEMLYDHRTDPEERVNIVENPLYAGKVQELREIFQKEYAQFLIPVEK